MDGLSLIEVVPGKLWQLIQHEDGHRYFIGLFALDEALQIMHSGARNVVKVRS